MRIYIIGIFFFSLIAAFLLLLPFSIHINDSLPNAGDPLFYAWNLMHNARSASDGFKNLFNTNIFYPETNTLALSDTLFAQSLITAPIIYFTQNAILAENIYTLLTFPLAAVSMFLLAHYLTKNKLASALVAMFFAFSYPRLTQISHISIISSQWLPLFILYLIKFFDSGKFKDILLCIVFFLLLLASTMYYGVFACIFGICIILAYSVKLLKKNPKSLWMRLKKILLLGIPVCIVIVLVVFPYIRLKAEHPEIHRSLDDAAARSSRVVDYVTVLPTSFISSIGLPKSSHDSVSFPTFTLSILALLGVIGMWTKRRGISLFFLFLASLSFFLSLGPSQPLVLGPYDLGYVKLPYYYAYKIFPLLQLVRAPGRFGIFFILSLCILAALGLTHISQKIQKKLLIPLYATLLLIFFVEVWQINTPFVTIPTRAQIPAVYTWLTTQKPNTVVAELPLNPMHWGNSIESQVTKPYSQITEQDMLASETYRVYFSSYHNKFIINGYSGFFPESYYTATKRLASFPSDDSVELLRSQGVTFAIVHLWQYTQEKRNAIKKNLSENTQLKLIGIFENDAVYEIIQ